MTFTKEEAHALARVQIAMWLPMACGQCGVEYASVDDFIDRNPRAGEGWKGEDGDLSQKFIDEACWGAYLIDHPDLPA